MCECSKCPTLSPSSETVAGQLLESSEEAVKLLLTVASGAVGGVDDVAAVTGVAGLVRNMIFFASGESRSRVWLNACHQQHEEQRCHCKPCSKPGNSQSSHSSCCHCFFFFFFFFFFFVVRGFSRIPTTKVQRLLDRLGEKAPLARGHEIFRN